MPGRAWCAPRPCWALAPRPSIRAATQLGSGSETADRKGSGKEIWRHEGDSEALVRAARHPIGLGRTGNSSSGARFLTKTLRRLLDSFSKRFPHPQPCVGAGKSK
jgi:hypothetical protein